jgi:hypothetical protein
MRTGAESDEARGQTSSPSREADGMRGRSVGGGRRAGLVASRAASGQAQVRGVIGVRDDR